MFKFLGISLLFAVSSWAAPKAQQSSTSTTPSSAIALPSNFVYFVVSASNLDGDDKDNDGLADPYVKVFSGKEPEGNGTLTSADLKLIEVSETVENNNSPSWNKVFKVKYIEGTRQLLYLEVRDHDPANPDDVMGDAYIKLDDFVARSTYTQVLEKAKSGSVTVTRTNPIYFDLLVRDIPAKDEFGGLSDPYVKCYFRVGKEGKDNKFHETETIDNAETAAWDQVPFENYQSGTNQIVHFRIIDKDTITGDDDLGEAFLELDPFVNGNRTATFSLPENASLTVTLNLGGVWRKRPIDKK